MPVRYGMRSRRGTKRGRGSRRGKYSNTVRTTKGYQISRRFTPSVKPFSTVDAGSTIRGGPLVGRGALPQTMVCTHRYVDQKVLNAEAVTGLTGTEQVYRLNSLFDPDFTGAGHQPYGFDQMANFYNLYCVYKVHIQIKIVEQSSNNPALLVNVSNSANGGYSTNAKKPWEELERPGNFVIHANGELKQWDQTLWIADIEGCSRSQIYNNDVYQAQKTTNPFLFPVLRMACGSDTGSTPANLVVNVAMVFHTVWSQPNHAMPRS